MPNAEPSQSMAYSTTDRIVVREFDLCEALIGRISFTAMIFLESMGRLPTPQEESLIDAVLVTTTEHGLTPSSIAARLTLLGSPEHLQGAVAAGVIGAGSVYLGAMQECSVMLQDLVKAGPGELEDRVRRFVGDRAAGGEPIPGLGHPIHKPTDPRVAVLFAHADDLGFPTEHRSCLELVHREAEAHFNRRLVVNAGGAIAAILSDAGLPAALSRGLAVIARAAGLVGHLLDEARNPVGSTIWNAAHSSVPYVPASAAPAVGDT